MFTWIAYLSSGIVAMLLIILKPKLFWPVLIFSMIFSIGIILGRQYTFLDEYMLVCVFLGALISKRFKKDIDDSNNGNIIDMFHVWIFLIFIAYMVLQSIRGMIILASFQKIRWIIFFIILIPLLFISSKKRFSRPGAKTVSIIIASSALFYFLFYINYGAFTELFRGVSRYDIQCTEWASTAYSLFPLAVAMPAIIFLINAKEKQYKLLGWLTLVASIFASFYYDSRIGWLTIIAFFIISVPVIGIKKSIGYAIIFVATLFFFSFFLWPAWRTPKQFSQDMVYTSKQIGKIYSKDNRDKHRHVLLQVMLKKELWNDAKKLLFGYGFRTHGFVVVPYITKFFKNDAPMLINSKTHQVATEAFQAMFIDTGLVGVLLLFSNFVFTGIKIFAQTKKFLRKYRYIFLSSLMLIFFWLFVINIIDVILLYFAISPNGLLVQLSSEKS